MTATLDGPAVILPPPPVRDDDPTTLRLTSADVAATIAAGAYGSCVMCHRMCYGYWDLSLCSVAPVLDAHGTLTDQVCLHTECVGALVGYWVNIITGGPADDEPQVMGGASAGRPADRAAEDTFRGEAERDAVMGGMYG